MPRITCCSSSRASLSWIEVLLVSDVSPLLPAAEHLFLTILVKKRPHTSSTISSCSAVVITQSLGLDDVYHKDLTSTLGVMALFVGSPAHVQ
jgi:hypothetical protein